jgi:Tfp pilus assembly protein PilF
VTLEQQAAQLGALVKPGISLTTINRCTDFAIDAIDAGRADLSIALLEPLVALAPNNARVWQVLGLAHRQMQTGDRALVAFQKAALLSPRDAKIAAGCATVTAEAGMPSALLFHQAMQLSPNDPELVLSAAASLKADGHWDVAEGLLERTLAANPAWLRGHEALATLRWTGGQTQDFARSFAEGCARAPDDLGLRLGWQRALAQAQDWAGARRVIEAGRAHFGPLPIFDAAEAGIATESGDDSAAERLFAAAEAVDDPGTRVAHIRHALRTGQIDKAEAIALEVTETPAAATAWPYLSLIWRLKQDPRAAWLDGDRPFVRVFDLPFAEGDLVALAERLRGLHNTRHHPAEQSLRGGTQTEGELLFRREPELRGVRALILNAVRDYVDGLPPHDPGHPLLAAPRAQLMIAGSWSVRLQSQGFHICHTHPLGWISSALYVALPSVMGAPPAGWLQLGASPPDLRIDLLPYAQIEPKPGRLVLFPSTMWHGTVPFDDGERLTIAFDVAVLRR